ncbi:MAG: hypothetical protein WB770_04190 [Acidimicrobiales bacterium]
MAKFLVTYHGGPGMPSDPEAARMMLEAFQGWAGGVGRLLVDPGAPVGAAKTVSASGATDGQNEAAIGGYSILEADDLEGAVALVESHPFIARGGTLQVSECVVVGG